MMSRSKSDNINEKRAMKRHGSLHENVKKNANLTKNLKRFNRSG